MKTLQQYPILIKCNLGTELKFADTLSRLYIRLSVITNSVEPKLSLLVMRKKDKCFPDDNTNFMKAMVLNYKEELSNLFSTLYCKLKNNHTTAYVPVLQKFNTILRYH